MSPAESRENPQMKTGNLDAFFREKCLTKNRVKEELVRQILQIYTTHQGIDVQGILDRMDIWEK